MVRRHSGPYKSSRSVPVTAEDGAARSLLSSRTVLILTLSGLVGFSVAASSGVAAWTTVHSSLGRTAALFFALLVSVCVLPSVSVTAAARLNRIID